MTSSRQPMVNKSVDEQKRQERQISASYFISSNNRSFIRNRNFAVYEPMSQSLPVQMEAKQEREPEEPFHDEDGNAISPLSQGHSHRFLDSEDDSDNSDAIIRNSNYKSDSVNMENSHAATPHQTQYSPQHHLDIATSPSFESDSSDFPHADSNNHTCPNDAKQVQRLTPTFSSPNYNNRSRIVSPTRSDYLSKIQAEMNSLQQDVLGMQESILALTRNLQRAQVARIRDYMTSKYGNHKNSGFSSDSSTVSGSDSIDALIAECLNSVNEESESRRITSHCHVVKSLDRRMAQQKERKSAIRNRFQTRQRQRRREEQSPSASMTPMTTPRTRELATSLESVQTPSSVNWGGHEHVKRTLFLAGHTPCAKAYNREGGDMTRDDRISRVLLFLVFVAMTAVLLTTDATARNNTKSRELTQILQNRRHFRSGLSAKKLTIDMQLSSCGKCDEFMQPYDPHQPRFIQDLRVWRSYREGKARLDPWRTFVLSVRARGDDPSAENYKHLVSEFTFWL